ncbi:MAG TPA: hypothetical protein ACHBX0_10900 [Arsenophonus sp.]
MGVIADRFRNFLHIRPIYADKAKPVSETVFDKLSQAMVKWGLPFEEGKIKKQLQILSERYTDNTPEKAYGKILAFSRLAEFVVEQHRHDFQLDIVEEYNN